MVSQPRRPQLVLAISLLVVVASDVLVRNEIPAVFNFMYFLFEVH